MHRHRRRNKRRSGGRETRLPRRIRCGLHVRIGRGQPPLADAGSLDIKTAASDSNWDEAKNIYTNGKNAQKSDGSYRTLAGFAAASGKNHNYDSFYGQDGAIGAHIMAAMDGTGDFTGASDTVRYQGIAKLTANMGMVGYTIHELNAAVAKADAGNTDNDSGAPHNWDEGWAFFHGPDEHWSCSLLTP